MMVVVDDAGQQAGAHTVDGHGAMMSTLHGLGAVAGLPALIIHPRRYWGWWRVSVRQCLRVLMTNNMDKQSKGVAWA